MKGTRYMSKRVWVSVGLLLSVSCSVNSWAFVVVGPDGKAEAKRKVVKPKAQPKQPAPAAVPKPVPPKVEQVMPAKTVTPSAPAVVPVPKAVPVEPVRAVKPIEPVIVPTPVNVVKPEPVKEQAGKVEPRHTRRSSGRTVKTKWQLGLGVEVGGDELGTVTYSDGSTASVKANTGFAINFGALMPNDDEGAWLTQLSVGYKSGGPRMWSADVNWSAIPLEVIEFYRTEDGIRMGLGVAYQVNPKLRVNTSNVTSEAQYNNAPGLVAQVGWQPARAGYSIDLRYTRVNFQPKDGSAEVGGSVGGLFMNFLF